MGAGFVQQGQAAADARRLALGDMAAGDVQHLPGDAHRVAGRAVQAVERDGPVPDAVTARGARAGAGAGVGAGARRGAREAQVQHGLAAGQHLAQRDHQALGLAGEEQVVRGEALQLGVRQPEAGREGVVDALQSQVEAEEEEAGRGLAEDGLGGGEVGLDPAEPAQVHGEAGGARVAAVGHQVDLGEALAAVGVAVRRGADPLLALQDAVQPGPAALPELARDEGGDRIGADRLGGGHAEELGGPAAPLADQTVGADREGGDPDVVVDGPHRAVTPADGGITIRRPARLRAQLSGHGSMAAATRRTPRRDAVQRTDPSNPRPSGCREDPSFIIRARAHTSLTSQHRIGQSFPAGPYPAAPVRTMREHSDQLVPHMSEQVK